MDVLTQEAMGQLFDVTDEIGLDRESLTVPLERTGDGAVKRRSDGRWEIQLPPGEDPLRHFLAALPGHLEGAGWTPDPEALRDDPA